MSRSNTKDKNKGAQKKTKQTSPPQVQQNPEIEPARETGPLLITKPAPKESPKPVEAKTAVPSQPSAASEEVISPAPVVESGTPASDVKPSAPTPEPEATVPTPATQPAESPALETKTPAPTPATEPVATAADDKALPPEFKPATPVVEEAKETAPEIELPIPASTEPEMTAPEIKAPAPPVADTKTPPQPATAAVEIKAMSPAERAAKRKAEQAAKSAAGKKAPVVSAGGSPIPEAKPPQLDAAPSKKPAPTIPVKEAVADTKAPASAGKSTPSAAKAADKTAPAKLPRHVAKDTAPIQHASFLDEKFSIKTLTEDPEISAQIKEFAQSLRNDRRERKANRVGKLMNAPEYSAFADTKLPGADPFESGANKPDTSSETGKARGYSAMMSLPEALTKASPTELKNLPAFKKKFALAEFEGDTADIKHKKSGEVVAALVLIPRKDQFKLAAKPGAGDRTVLAKTRGNPSLGATHVVDTAGVATRRFAYFETSRQQLMAALETDTSAFRGRFARYRRAMNVTNPSDILSIPQDDTELAAIYGRKPGPMTLDQMAHLHQYQGNEHQQRGVSLTSTPKREIVSNEGGTFRSHDGVRIKVDLSLVPKDVILLNHYSEGGVGDRLAELESAGTPGVPGMHLSKPLATDEEKQAADKARAEGREPVKRPGYNYQRSVAKNRELFLSRLEPAWIVDLEDHLKDIVSDDKKSRMASPAQSIARVAGPEGKPGAHADLADLRGKVGFDHYERGRKLGRTGQDAPTDDDPFVAANLAMGHAAGVEERLGLSCGRSEYDAFWDAFTLSIDRKDRKPVRKNNDESRVAEVARAAANSIVPKDADQTTTKQAIPVAREMIRRASRWYALTQLRGRNVYTTGKPIHDGMHDSFWIGWAESAGGNPEEVKKKLKAEPAPVPVEADAPAAETTSAAPATTRTGSPAPESASAASKSDSTPASAKSGSGMSAGPPGKRR